MISLKKIQNNNTQQKSRNHLLEVPTGSSWHAEKSGSAI
tara:strand:- start:4110 stop:4226 length:117 start_codon:yes stop_codon:yes gene_type:complete